MFLRHKIRNKDGKRHRYWSVVENKRVAGGGVVQKHVLHLGEINDSQELAWRRSIEVLDEAADRPKTLSLFPEDRAEGLLPDASIVRLKLAVELLSATRSDRGGVPKPEGRSRHPADPSSGRGAHRGAYLFRVPGLLPACHHRHSPEGTGARADPAQPVREIRGRSDD